MSVWVTRGNTRSKGAHKATPTSSTSNGSALYQFQRTDHRHKDSELTMGDRVDLLPGGMIDECDLADPPHDGIFALNFFARAASVASQSSWRSVPVRNKSTHDGGSPEKSILWRPQSGTRPS